MKTTINLMIIMVIILVLISCNAADKARERNYEFQMYMDSWLGAHVSELLLHDHWGAYYSKVADGKGGNIYSWKKAVSDIGIYKHWSGEYRAYDNSYVQYWEFYTDPNGVITSYRYGSQ